MSAHKDRMGDASASSPGRPLGVAAFCALLLLTVTEASSQTSSQATQTLDAKIQELAHPHPNASGLPPMVITEAEATSYLRLHGGAFLPGAVQSPELKIEPDKISAAADVDFDELGEIGRQKDDWGARFVALLFRGRQRVKATGKLETGNGQGTVKVESLSVGTTDIPAAFVNFLVQEYVERRYALDLSKPFHLPPNVTHIELGAGQATFHRGTHPGLSNPPLRTRP